MELEESKLFANLKFIPQVSLLAIPRSFFKQAQDQLIKRIICQEQFCSETNLCHNCQKFQNNSYFDLQHYQFTTTNLLKKQDVSSIITLLSQQSIEQSNPKICLLEGVEYSSLEAVNSFLKFLENLPSNTYVIFVSANVGKVLATIKSRSQIFTLANGQKNDEKNQNFNAPDFLVVKDVIGKFIHHDNTQKFSENFFLIKEIVETKEKVYFFLQFLLLLAEQKLTGSLDDKLDKEIKAALNIWKNKHQKFLINMIECLTELINKFSNTKNLNLNLLLNYFFIRLYQGQENGW